MKLDLLGKTQARNVSGRGMKRREERRSLKDWCAASREKDGGWRCVIRCQKHPDARGKNWCNGAKTGGVSWVGHRKKQRRGSPKSTNYKGPVNQATEKVVTWIRFGGKSGINNPLRSEKKSNDMARNRREENSVGNLRGSEIIVWHLKNPGGRAVWTLWEYEKKLVSIA